jgi:hypothetical protein
VVETVAKIRRAYFAWGKSIKANCSEPEVSRKVVRKVPRSEATEFRYEREPTAGRSRSSRAADIVINILARRREPVPPITIVTPDALRPHHTPVADRTRYDSLRRSPRKPIGDRPMTDTERAGVPPMLPAVANPPRPGPRQHPRANA